MPNSNPHSHNYYQNNKRFRKTAELTVIITRSARWMKDVGVRGLPPFSHQLDNYVFVSLGQTLRPRNSTRFLPSFHQYNTLYILQMLQEKFDPGAEYEHNHGGFTVFLPNQDSITPIVQSVVEILEQRGWGLSYTYVATDTNYNAAFAFDSIVRDEWRRAKRQRNR